MILYVKFCGGCNPTFDRGMLAKQIASLLDAQILNSHPEQADACLLVSGCSRNCAKIVENFPHITIDHKVKAENIAGKLNNLFMAKK